MDIAYDFIGEHMPLDDITELLDYYTIDDIQFFMQEGVITPNLAASLHEYLIYRFFLYRWGSK